MNTERKELHLSIREGYQILLRADAVLELPIGYEKIRAFYETLAEKCMLWIRDVHGELLRKDFLETESIREKSRFGTQSYRFQMHVAWEEETYVCILCESWLKGQAGETKNSYHRMAQLWNTKEETALPFSQILKLFPTKKSDFVLPFSPDGIYPLEKEVVFYKNASATVPFAEYRSERVVDK